MKPSFAHAAPSLLLAGLAVLLIPALPSTGDDARTGSLAPLAAQDAAAEPACEPQGMPLEDRASPYDSVSVGLGEASVKVCYGRPSARGRTMIGGEAVPFGELWRAGANEPTTLHTTGPIEVAGIELEPGSYSLYTRPGESEWEVFISRSTDRWGIPITAEVQAEEVGSTEVPRERPESHVETMLLRFENAGAEQADLALEWEDFRIVLPVRAR